MVHQVHSSVVSPLHFHYAILTKTVLQSKTELNFNHQHCSLIIKFILKKQTECQLLTTIHWNRLLLNTQPHVNFLLPKILNQLVILSLNQFVMTPLLITLEIPYMNFIYHQFTMSGNITKEKTGKNIWIVITTSLQSRH